MPRVRSAASVSLAVLGCGPVAAFAGLSPTCFRNTDVQHTLPLAPSSYPEELQGILWMDQGGAYGHSDVPVASPDLSLSFGDTAYSKWDPKTRSIKVEITGPAWAWQNNWKADAMYGVSPGAHWTFRGNEDLSNFELEGGFPGVAWSMAKITPQPDVVCPPPPGTSKRDIVKCAAFDRISTAFGHVVHYYVWRIVDGQGNPIQPYYDEYIKFANSVSDHSSIGGWAIGLSGDCSAPNTGFRGVRSGASKFSAGNSSIVHASAFVV